MRAVLLRQIYFTGLQALVAVTATGLALGFASEMQMRTLLGSGVDLNVKLLKGLVLREVGPLVVALIVLGRSGSAMATELADMRVRGDIRSLYRMGIDPSVLLLSPRILATMVSVIVLTLYCQLVAAVVGPALTSLLYPVSLAPYYRSLLESITLTELLWSLAKSAAFGWSIAVGSCASGIFVVPEATAIPQAAELAARRGFLSILACDLVFVLILILFL